jgi:hypothetical protein
MKASFAWMDFVPMELGAYDGPEFSLKVLTTHQLRRLFELNPGNVT